MTTKKTDDYKCSLSPATIEKAKKELNETPDTRLIEVNTLRNRLENLPGLVLRKGTTFLLQFLRARKFDQEKAYQMVKDYYEIRRDNSEVFSDMKPSRFRPYLDTGIFEILKDRNMEGCKVVIVRAKSWDPENQPLMMFIPAVHLIVRAFLEEEETQVHGIHLIASLEGFSWRQLSAFTPTFCKMLTRMVQDCLPLRVKRIDVTHQPIFFDALFALFKPFLSQKLSSRVFLNGEKFETIHKIINPDCLPTDFGGKLAIQGSKAWMNTFLESDAKFEDDNKFGFVNMAVNKDKRADKSENADLTGLGGTFKRKKSF